MVNFCWWNGPKLGSLYRVSIVDLSGSEQGSLLPIDLQPVDIDQAIPSRWILSLPHRPLVVINLNVFGCRRFPAKDHSCLVNDTVSASTNQYSSGRQFCIDSSYILSTYLFGSWYQFWIWRHVMNNYWSNIYVIVRQSFYTSFWFEPTHFLYQKQKKSDNKREIFVRFLDELSKA